MDVAERKLIPASHALLQGNDAHWSRDIVSRLSDAAFPGRGGEYRRKREIEETFGAGMKR